jgi:hypothetical protein
MAPREIDGALQPVELELPFARFKGTPCELPNPNNVQVRLLH